MNLASFLSALAGLLVGFCASFTTLTHTPATPIPLRLVVTSNTSNNNPNALSYTMTITNPALVQKLYDDIEALPKTPERGQGGCVALPAYHTEYNLAFYGGDMLLLLGTFCPDGCIGPVITLENGTSNLVPSGRFEADLAHSLGLSAEQLLTGSH
jgi:hypothetical protein